MPVKKRRGAQPGNLNALKHGFYSRSFKELENSDLEAMLAQDLESEIVNVAILAANPLERLVPDAQVIVAQATEIGNADRLETIEMPTEEPFDECILAE